MVWFFEITVERDDDGELLPLDMPRWYRELNYDFKQLYIPNLGEILTRPRELEYVPAKTDGRHFKPYDSFMAVSTSVAHTKVRFLLQILSSGIAAGIYVVADGLLMKSTQEGDTSCSVPQITRPAYSKTLSAFQAGVIDYQADFSNDSC